MTRIIVIFLLISNYAYSKDREFYKNLLPFENSRIKTIYQLDNKNIIYISRFERGDIIWEKKYGSKSINEISFVMNFIAIAKWCEGINEKNIYFAQNREYWLGGGAIIDYAQIRVFNIYDSSPWRDSDLGIVDNMKSAEDSCEFYDPIFYDNW